MNDQDFPHLHREAALVAGRDDEYRTGWLKKLHWIDYPEARKIQDRIWEAVEQPPSNPMENILLVGESGVGKTALIKKIVGAYDVVLGNPPYFSPRPVVMVPMPYKPGEREFLEGILTALATPKVQLGPIQHLRLQPLVSELLRRSGTRVLIIDEINSILAGNLRQQRNFLQLLRFISNDVGVTLVCVGTPEARYALDADPQLRSRFCDVEMPVWRHGADLQKFINLFVQSKPLRSPSPVESNELCKLVADRSKGITSSICKAINYAAVDAIRNGREMIDLAALQDISVWRAAAINHLDKAFIRRRNQNSAAETTRAAAA